jgi:hypothetical protein
MTYVIIFLPPHCFIIQNKNSHIVLVWNACMGMPETQVPRQMLLRWSAHEFASFDEMLIPRGECCVLLVGIYYYSPGLKYDAPLRMRERQAEFRGPLTKACVIALSTKPNIWSGNVLNTQIWAPSNPLHNTWVDLHAQYTARAVYRKHVYKSVVFDKSRLHFY